MAAADFYNAPTGPEQRRPSYLAPPQAPQAPQRANSNPNVKGRPQFNNTPPYPSPALGSTPPQYPPPPAYDSQKPGVHFAPSPHPQRSSFSGQRPPPQMFNPPPQQYGPPAPYNPQAYQYQQQYQQPPHAAPHMRPYMHQNHSDASLGGYSSDPEPHRRRHKHSKQRRISESSRSTTTDGFLGAAGGGLIGDLIFPGLGTVGGALAGWIGGKDYGEHRKHKEIRRDREQESWERRYSRDHSRGSHHSDGRRHSHDRRKSEY